MNKYILRTYFDNGNLHDEIEIEATDESEAKDKFMEITNFNFIPSDIEIELISKIKEEHND